MLPSGNDAAIVLATAFGKWLYFQNGRKVNTAIAKKTNQEKTNG